MCVYIKKMYKKNIKLEREACKCVKGKATQKSKAMKRQKQRYTRQGRYYKGRAKDKATGRQQHKRATEMRCVVTGNVKARQ